MLEPMLIEILEDYFAIEDTYVPANLIPIRKRFLEFLRAEENLLAPVDNKNVVIAKDTIRLIDAHNIYTTTSDRIASSWQIQPFFDRLLTYDDWSYYELKILADAIMFAPTASLGVQLGAKSILPIVAVRLAGSSDLIQGRLAGNLCSRLLYAKYFEDDNTIDIEDKFLTWFKKLERLAENNKTLALAYLQNQVRHALFFQHQEEIFRLCELVKTELHEQKANAFISTVSFYTAAKKYNAMLYEGVSD